MPEVSEKLARYCALLKKWQRAVNLVSPATLAEAKRRHFDDSLQLADLIPQGARLFDLGSGAGFPGMVLAIARPDLAVTLIESDQKKCTFLSTVSRETATPVTVLNQRIESVSRETIPAIITARALAPLDKLLGYCLPWAEKNLDLKMIFQKGRKAQEELDKAHARYRFAHTIYPSRTEAESVVIVIENLSAPSGD